MKKNFGLVALATVVFAVPGSAQQFTNVDPCSPVSGDQCYLAPGARVNSNAAYAAFLAAISGQATAMNDIQSTPLNTTSPFSLNFGAITTGNVVATPGSVNFVANGNSTNPNNTSQLFNQAGLYGTTDGGADDLTTDQFYFSNAGFMLNFTTAVKSFGFTGVDIGDFNKDLTVTYRNGTTVLTTFNFTDVYPTGSVFFIGYNSAATNITSVEFSYVNNSIDGFGFDNLIAGVPGAPPTDLTPEPASMTLLATGLVGLGARSLRRRNKKS